MRDPSEIICNLAQNISVEKNLTHSQFAAMARPPIDPKTFQRIVRTSQSIPRSRVAPVVGAIASLLGASPSGIHDLVHHPSETHSPLLLSLALGRSFTPYSSRSNNVAKLAANPLEFSNMIVFVQRLPVFMWEDEPRYRILNHLARNFPVEPDRAVLKMDALAESFRNSLLALTADDSCSGIVILTTMSGMISAVRRKPPLRHCGRSELFATFQSFRRDFVEGRGLRLRVLNDLLLGPAADWVSAHADLGCMAMVRDHDIIVRPRGSAVCRVVRRHDSADAARFFSTCSTDLLIGAGLACHDTSQDGVSAFLKKFIRAAFPFGPDDSLN